MLLDLQRRVYVLIQEINKALDDVVGRLLTSQGKDSCAVSMALEVESSLGSALGGRQLDASRSTGQQHRNPFLSGFIPSLVFRSCLFGSTPSGPGEELAKEDTFSLLFAVLQAWPRSGPKQLFG